MEKHLTYIVVGAIIAVKGLRPGYGIALPKPPQYHSLGTQRV